MNLPTRKCTTTGRVEGTKTTDDDTISNNEHLLFSARDIFGDGCTRPDVH